MTWALALRNWCYVSWPWPWHLACLQAHLEKVPRLKALGLRLEEPLKGIGLKAAILVLSDIGLGSKSRIRPIGHIVVIRPLILNIGLGL